MLRLNKAVYKLWQSSLLWYQKLTNILKSFGFTEIPQKLYVMQKNDIICFFFIDDIIFTSKKEKSNEIKQIVNLLSKTLTIKLIRKLK